MLSHNCPRPTERWKYSVHGERARASCCRVPLSQYLRVHVRLLQVVVDRVDTVRTQRDLHVEILNLLKDNAALRTSARNTCIPVCVCCFRCIHDPFPLHTHQSKYALRSTITRKACSPTLSTCSTKPPPMRACLKCRSELSGSRHALHWAAGRQEGQDSVAGGQGGPDDCRAWVMLFSPWFPLGKRQRGTCSF